VKFCSVVSLFLFVSSSLTIRAEDDTSTLTLKWMKSRAAATTISFQTPDPTSEIELLPNPLFRYSDRPRKIIDGSFWCWEHRGRPVAFQKVEHYEHSDPAQQWLYCFASASKKRLNTEWGNGQSWSAEQPGISFVKLTDTSPRRVTRQNFPLLAKAAAQKFSVLLTEEFHNSQEQLRFLPRPIHQYVDESGIIGAVFGFASGTNPDALLLIEFDPRKESVQWRYAWIRMTICRLSVTLNAEEVWSVPYRPFSRMGKYESWMFYLEDAQPETK
jgi:hypothetical protein